MLAPARGSRRPHRYSVSLLATTKPIGFVGDGEDLVSEHYLRFDYSPSSSATSSAAGVSSRGGYHTVGLESDGTMVVAGWNDYGQCNAGDWTGIVQITAGWCHTVGLKSNSTVIAAGLEVELAKWDLF